MSKPASYPLYPLDHPHMRSFHKAPPPVMQLPKEPTRVRSADIPLKARLPPVSISNVRPSNATTNMDLEEKHQESSVKLKAAPNKGALPPGPHRDEKQREGERDARLPQPNATALGGRNGERPKLVVSSKAQYALDVAAAIRQRAALKASSVPATVVHMDVDAEREENKLEPRHNHKVGMRMATVLRQDEIAELKRFHDNSLAATSRKAYTSDYRSFTQFLAIRFPDVEVNQLQQQCTLEHVLAYLNHLCKEGRKISTINRRLSTIKKHILPALFTRAIVPGSREEQIAQDMDAIVRGIRRVVGGEQRIRGKRPLLIENITAMVDLAAQAVNSEDEPIPNTRCRDVCLFLFMFFSAMRRSEVSKLLWSNLTFDKRGVVVQIRQSKTDKEAKGQTIALSRLDGTPKAAYCPVQALEAWQIQSGGMGESPVFRWISKKDEIQWRILIDQRIVAIIKRYAKMIGLDEKCFAAHSTRSGYVTSSSERGVPVAEMMKRTRHKSLSSVQVYMKSEDLFQGSGDRRL